MVGYLAYEGEALKYHVVMRLLLMVLIGAPEPQRDDLSNPMGNGRVAQVLRS